ncbi:MAG TPA: DUF3073 domain-containing protein [Glaciihabitans sp.]|jgi:hypothetical protein|nr:DUF3073 domain-containing protein [Glaciihabitans sp.]
MGRGRQKAKHTKVARDLKYFSPDTNYGALANELHSGGAPVAPVAPVSPDLDKWSEYLVDDNEDDEYGSGQESSKSA